MGVFDDFKDLNKRTVADYSILSELTDVMKKLDHKIVVTIGTYDLAHVGHYRYLARARAEGDILIVGLDSDSAVKRYKDPTRPIIPEAERMETLLHSRYVDFVTLIDDVDEDGNWGFGLIDVIRPDVFVAVEDSYSEEQLEQIQKYCGNVIVLPPQSKSSTSEAIRQSVISQTKPFIDLFRSLLEQLERGEPPQALSDAIQSFAPTPEQ